MILRSFLFGLYFGGVLILSGLTSWSRMAGLFYLQDPHVLLVFSTAVIVAYVSTHFLTKLRKDTEPLNIPTKAFTSRTVYGSVLFGVGWGLTGLCPGPLYVHVGAGTPTALFVFFGALLGAVIYGVFDEHFSRSSPVRS